MQATAAGTPEDWRAASNIAVSLSEYLVTVSISVIAGQVALAAALAGRVKRPRAYFLVSVVASVLLVVSIIYGGWAIADVYKAGFNGQWRDNASAAQKYDVQAELLLLGFITVLVSVALALIPEKPDGGKKPAHAQPTAKETIAFLLISSVIFLATALGHALRLIFGWTAAVGSWAVPKWPSWVALIIAELLNAWGIWLRKRSS
jgi:hypothetical protein